jgi:hypothetical protein
VHIYLNSLNYSGFLCPFSFIACDEFVSVQVAEILKDRPSWFRDCRCLDIMSVIPTGSGGTIELIYMQVCTCTL